MNKKKVFLAVLALILVCSLSVAGTLALLTASQSGNQAVINTFVAAGDGEIIDPDGPTGPVVPNPDPDDDVVPEDNDDKDAYTGVETVDLTPYIGAGEGHTVTVPVNLNRPLGRWRLVADDIADFEAAGGNASALWTRATYISFVSSGYNVESQEPNLFDEPQSRTFFHPIYNRSSGEMTHDYIFVYGKESYVSLYLEFYEGDRKISSWNVPDVPLMRNRETLIHGRFLTSSSQSGGIGIDPGFNGEHIVPVKRDEVPTNGILNK